MHELDRPSEGISILQGAESVLSAAPPQATVAVPENALLQRFRGHRTRTWGVPEALRCLELVRDGHDVTEAATLSGVPVSVALGQGDQGPAGRLLRDAILSVYAHEGADWYSRQNRRVVTGELPPQATGAIRTGLQEHGRLRDRTDATGTASAQQTIVQLQVYLGTLPPQQQQQAADAIEARLSQRPGR